LVYSVETVTEPEFQNREWNISKLAGFKTGRASALPFAVSLTKLMKVLAKQKP